jgi:hypothetical protein
MTEQQRRERLVENLCTYYDPSWWSFCWRASLAWLLAMAPWLALGACGASQPEAVVTAQQAEVAAYAAEEQQCVALAATRGQAHECIGTVRARWCAPGMPLAEAQACLYDAGLNEEP